MGTHGRPSEARKCPEGVESRRGHQKSVHIGVRIFTFYLFTIHYSLKIWCTDFEVIGNIEKGISYGGFANAKHIFISI